MKKVEMYIQQLQNCRDWDEYLMTNSGLPGPRGNLELAEAVRMIGSEEAFLKYISLKPEEAPENTREVFLVFCGVVGLGRLISEGKNEYLKILQQFASDPRWRIREAVAIALQAYGERDMDGLINDMKYWAEGNNYEKRAAAAALCEPKLLKKKEQVMCILQILDKITESIRGMKSRNNESFKTLKKGMAYCWSVAIVKAPDEGKRMFERWLLIDDRDINWIIKENLKKDRLKRMDEVWLQKCKDKIGTK